GVSYKSICCRAGQHRAKVALIGVIIQRSVGPSEWCSFHTLIEETTAGDISWATSQRLLTSYEQDEGNCERAQNMRQHIQSLLRLIARTRSRLLTVIVPLDGGTGVDLSICKACNRAAFSMILPLLSSLKRPKLPFTGLVRPNLLG